VNTISGKAVLITGASSGIGRATALALAREKARLFLVARRHSRLLEVAEQIAELGGTAFVHSVDLRDHEAADALVGIAHEKLQRIDVLINNAAFGYFGSVENMPCEVSREIFDVNFSAPLLAMQRAIPIMKRQGSGHIINISSVAGKRGLPLSGIYCATKFALNGISESLRVELVDTNIRVSVVNPTYTKSEFHDAVRRGDVTGKFTPMGHMQTSEEVAHAIVRCIKRPKAEVYPYSISRLVVWINAVAPSLMDAIILPYFRDRMKARNSQGV
jgi:uncharacterized protein